MSLDRFLSPKLKPLHFALMFYDKGIENKIERKLCTIPNHTKPKNL